MSKEGKLEALFHLKNQLTDYTITKATPRKIITIENRMNRKLRQISNRTIDKLINNPNYNTRIVEEPIRTLYATNIPQLFQTSALELIKQPQYDLTQNVISTPTWDRLISERTFNASETTINRLVGDVFEKIRDGVVEGRSLDRTTLELQTEFRGMTDWQIQRITRTETHTTHNSAKQEMFNHSTVITGKQWISSGLSNSRPWHEEANGQTVAYDEPFIVDNEALMFPGDPDGSPSNIINCACTMVPDIRYKN